MLTEKEFHYSRMTTGQIKKHREIWKKVYERMPTYRIAKDEYDLLTKLLFRRIHNGVQ